MTSINPDHVPDYLSLLRLDGRNIIVVGAGLGMGRQTSHALAHSGARVVCVDIDDTLARKVAAEVGGIAWVGDVTQASEVDRLIAEATAALGGPISGFVDIVGLATWAAAVDIEESAWDAQFDICLRHAYLLGTRIGRHLIDAGAGGTMVFIASVHGLTASVRHGAYGAAKAGLISWVKTLANELGSDGIRVNAIAPGSIVTPRILAAGNPELREKAAQIAPLRRNGLPAEVASTALFLTSDLASFITGQTLAVDGGVTIADPFERLTL